MCLNIAALTQFQPVNASLLAKIKSTNPPIVKPGAPGDDSRAITVEESLAMGSTSLTDADTSFMQNMILHHGQAVEMVALIEKRTNHRGISLLGKRISLSQKAEINMMRKWLSRRGQEIETKGGHGVHSMFPMSDMVKPSETPIMVGMLSPLQMITLEKAEDKIFERLFLRGMVQHHEGALHMVQGLLTKPGNGEDPELSNFLAAINADQSTEILRMKNMLLSLKGN